MYDLYSKVKDNAWGAFTAPAVIMLVVVMVLIVAFIVYVEPQWSGAFRCSTPSASSAVK